MIVRKVARRLMDFLAHLFNWGTLATVIDILIVWYLIYKLLMYTRRTQAINLLKGFAVIIVARAVTQMLQLKTLGWLMNQFMTWGVLAVIILFQPELRRGLESIGRGLTRSRRGGISPSMRLVDDLEYAAHYMSKRKIGALISIQLESELNEYIESGIELDALVGRQLLINIFIPNTPLHDGAVVIRDYRVAAASCFLPLSDNSSISKELGTRHRAAIGLSEVTDALTLIVSEETGGISLTKDNRLYRDLDRDQLRDYLEEFLLEDEDNNDNDLWRTIRTYIVPDNDKRGES